MLFPPELADPSLDVDPAESKVWVNSEIVLEVRGSVSKDEVLTSLDVRPPLHLNPDDITIEHVAPLPWHKDLPWAKTRVVINPHRSDLFKPQTNYTVSLKEESVDFKTITVPQVVDVRLDNPVTTDWANVPTSAGMVVTFNEPVAWHDSHLRVDPPQDVRVDASTLPDGRSAVRISPATRWDNSTAYSVSIEGAVEDRFGHKGTAFSRRFTTWARPKIVAGTPEGPSQGVEFPVRVQFERPADRASVEASFHIDPSVNGAFTWESDTVLVWRAEKLQNSTDYKLSVDGLAVGGDSFVPREWAFRTQDPPVFVDIKGRGSAPAVLEAVASGGLGAYSYQWNTGETGPKILFQGVPGETQTAQVTVKSGDRTEAKAVQLERPAGYTYNPVPCTEGWSLIEVDVCYREETLPGPVHTFVARVDLKDPNVQLRDVPAYDTVGVARPVSAKERGSDAVVATNADYFHMKDPLPLTLGPVMAGGSFSLAPLADEPVLAMDRSGKVWSGPAQDLQLSVQASDGSSAWLVSINEPARDGQLTLLNGYWGNQVLLAGDECYAAFTPVDASAPEASSSGCGPGVAQIPAGGYDIVARGSATDWLNQEVAAGPIQVSYSFPLPGLDFIVAGSDILVKEGQPAAVPGGPDPQTALGIDGNGFAYMIVVDGRSPASVGLSLAQMRDYAMAMGVVNAIALDGGGSSTMVLLDALHNSPSDGAERPVASVIEAGPTHPRCWNPFIRCQ